MEYLEKVEIIESMMANWNNIIGRTLFLCLWCFKLIDLLCHLMIIYVHVVHDELSLTHQR
jgi:hypothetical protein